MFINNIVGDEIQLSLQHDVPAEPAKGWVRALHYHITSLTTGIVMGKIDLRLGYTMDLVQYGGHIGYGVHQAYRGHRYAAKACILLKQVAIAHRMDVLWITCNPDNWPSRKTCEYIGATLVEIVTLPPENDQYQRGERQKCRYRWILY